jgi:hypothetical protein
MSAKLSWGALATALVLSINGCAAPSAITRGQSYDGMIYGDEYSSAEGNEYGLRPRQYDRFQAQGIIPPPGSPYAGGYTPTYTPSDETQPGRVVNGVPIYDGMGGARDLGPFPNDMAYRRRHDNGEYDFMPGGCPQCGADYIRHMPTHHSTFAYHRPADLSYPGPNSVGGAVVYSYYTLKGPADFFYTGE